MVHVLYANSQEDNGIVNLSSEICHQANGSVQILSCNHVKFQKKRMKN